MKFNFEKYLCLFMVAVIIASANQLRAQEISTLYYMNNLPQANGINPAIVTDRSKIVIGLPVLSGIEAGMNNTFSLSDILTVENKTLWIDLNRFQEKIPATNKLSETLRISLFFFQYRTSDKIFSFNITEKQNSRTLFDRSLIELINFGNSPWQGKTFTTSYDFNFMHYREYALGYTDQITEKLRIGGRFKLLTGFMAFDARKSKLNVETGADAEFLKIETEGAFNLSVPVTLQNNAGGKLDIDSMDNNGISPKSYLMNFSNPGFAADLGATYQITPKIELSACITDLGFIGWKKDVYQLSQGGSFTWKGIDVSETVDSGDIKAFSNQFKSLSDSALSALSVSSHVHSFSTTIPTSFYIGGKYQFNKYVNAGLFDQMMVYDGITTNTISVSGNAQLGEVFSFSANYSTIGNSFSNLGIGMTLKLGPIQLYGVTNKILAMINLPNAHNFNTKLGINLLFGKRY